MTHKFAAPVAGAIIALAAASAQAQQAAPAAAVTPQAAAVANAPTIPGVCVFSQERALAGSAVGKYINQRLQQIDTQTNAELNGERTKLETDARALDGQRATLSQEQLQQQAQALQQRAQQFEQLVQIRVRESELTQQKALRTVGQSLDPLLVDAFKARNCAVLMDNNSLFMFSSAMDLTPEIVTKLDAKIQQFPLDRESLPAQSAAQGGAARPATGAAAPARPAAAQPAGPARRR